MLTVREISPSPWRSNRLKFYPNFYHLQFYIYYIDWHMYMHFESIWLFLPTLLIIKVYTISSFLHRWRVKIYRVYISKILILMFLSVESRFSSVNSVQEQNRLLWYCKLTNLYFLFSNAQSNQLSLNARMSARFFWAKIVSWTYSPPYSLNLAV